VTFTTTKNLIKLRLYNFAVLAMVRFEPRFPRITNYFWISVSRYVVINYTISRKYKNIKFLNRNASKLRFTIRRRKSMKPRLKVHSHLSGAARRLTVPYGAEHRRTASHGTAMQCSVCCVKEPTATVIEFLISHKVSEWSLYSSGSGSRGLYTSLKVGSFFRLLWVIDSDCMRLSLKTSFFSVQRS